MTSINANTNVDVQNKKSHVFRNTLIGATAGALIGGDIADLTTKLVKDNLPSDKFVHSIIKENCINIAKQGSLLKIEGLGVQIDKIKDLAKNENLKSEDLKVFLEKNKKIFKPSFRYYTSCRNQFQNR